MTAPEPGTGPRVVVLAEDLIWGQRLADQLAAIGALPVASRGGDGLEADLVVADALIVDLAARRFDAVEAIRRARAKGLPVLAVGPHDDQELRQAAFAAGADRVLAYRKLFEDGPAALTAWLDRVGAAGVR